MLPLWLGMVPFGAAYAVSARAAGLSLLETQLMSLVVFSGGAQFSAAGLFAANASPTTVVATTFLINARHLLYGVSLGQIIPLGWRERLVAAHLLTDEAYGVTFGSPVRSVGFFVGAGSSLFFIWNLSTLLGALLSRLVPNPAALGIDFIFPLAFLALLIPLLRGWPALAVAVFAGLLALVAAQVMNSGLAVLLAGVAGPLVGAYLTRKGTA
jgi:4-azaleucine resistance transporter AzlC